MAHLLLEGITHELGVSDEGVMLGECGVVVTVEDDSDELGSADELGVLDVEVVDGVEVVEGVVVDGVGLGVLLALLALLVLEVEGTAMDDDELEPPEPPEPLPPFSNTTTWAFSPLGTVTTQKLAPPAPGFLPPIISLTLLTSGSILQGRPLQLPPSQTTSTPKSGITSRNGVAGSR